MGFSGKISLRAKLFASPLLAIAILLAIAAAASFIASREDAAIGHLQSTEIARADEVSEIFANLSNVHDTISAAFDAAAEKKIGEERIYAKGRDAIEQTRLLVDRFSRLNAMFQHDSGLREIFRDAQNEFKTYLMTLVAAVDLSTADPGLAGQQLRKANASYFALARSMSRTVSISDQRLAVRLKDMRAATNNSAQALLIAAGAAFMILAALAALFYVDLSRSIGRLVTTINGIGGGQLDREVPHQARSDEIGTIARSLEQWRGREIERLALVEQQDVLRSKQAERAATVSALVEEFRQVAASGLSYVDDNLRRVQQTSGTLSAVASETSRHVDSLTQSSRRMSAEVQIVAASAEELGVSFSHVSEETSRAHEYVLQADGKAGTATRTVDQLAKGAARIAEISRVISQVAGQINLLALNATIEAARAGEYGRGFSVVATEVKSLANQTAVAASEIESVVASINQLVTDTVQAVQSTISVVGDLGGFTQNVASALDQQSASTSEIANSSQRAAVGVQQLAANIESFEDIIKQSNEASAAASDAASDLSARTRALQAAVSAFLSKVAAA